MNQRLKNFLGAVGSVLAIFPTTNYASFVPKGTPEQRIRAHWERSGVLIQSSMDKFSDEQKKFN